MMLASPFFFAIVNKSTKRHQMNYFNTNIIERHDDHMYLNNSMAECYDFCLNVAEVCDSKSDAAWWASMKKGHLCFDL